jgi:hypothetical protein
MKRSPNIEGLPMRRLSCLLLIALLLTTVSGCGFMSHMMYWTGGNQVKPKFAGLKKKKVAVVCFDANSAGQAGDADALARAVAQKLAMHGDQITIIKHQQILDWIDKQPGNVSDYQAVGRGVKADMVVGIDLDSFSTHDGTTLLRGRARVSTKVYDVSKPEDNLVYQTPPLDVNYPESGPRPITDNEGQFRSIFLDILARKVSKDFYSYERMEDFGLDSLYGGG